MPESDLLKDFIAICGQQNISSKELDLIAYTSDLASLPPLIKQIYKIQFPKYIIRPSTSEEISKIIKIAVKYKIPFTVRAGASSGNGGVIPIDGGLILDLTQMQEILNIDPRSYQVTVQPGITWAKLNFELNKIGCITGIYPSSSPSATVGGFISTGGYAGIGAPKYGPIGQQVQKLQVVLPSGEVSNIYPPLSSLFIGAEGTLGVITEITLAIYPKSQIVYPLAFGFNDIDSAVSLLQTIIKLGLKPYHVMLFDKYFFDISKALGLKVPKNEIVVFLTLEGTELAVQADAEKIRSSFSETNELPKEIADNEWDRRFKAELYIKRAGPSLILLEIGTPLINVPQIYKTFQEMGVREKTELGFCGILGHGSTMLCMPFILTDERKGMDYLKVLSFSRKLVSKAIRFGGYPYGIGLWGSSYLPYIYEQEKLKIISNIKHLFDRNNLCNPGKITEDRTPEQMRPPKP
ncbi:MAG: FAD-binding oxidoreductase [Candidatus Helarchaeota archaeon]|nr:FAD-binding oxidoreductase [Candidatus Helarchaeota archaeon]